MNTNLTDTNKDYAVYLPSISSFYSKMLGNVALDDQYIKPERIPAGFEKGIDGCDFLKKDGYYNYKWGLYSAGHAILDTDKSDIAEAMIQQRNKADTWMLGDSGGFQIGKGVINFDWERFYETPSDAKYVGEADRMRMKILNWLEHTADASMVLDIPAWAAAPVNTERTGLKSFKDCLEGTLFNNDFFERNAQGKTAFLNVLQGGNEHEADIWYDAVKKYSKTFCKGYAMGGQNMRDMHLALRRIITLRDEGLLEEGQDVIHFLGTGKLDWSVILTAIQRNIRKHINPNMLVTLDAASPFLTVVKGQLYTQHTHRNDKFAYVMESAVDDKRLCGSDIPLPWNSPIADRLTMGDINYMGPGMLNKLGKEGKTAWDSFSYFLLMAHNVYNHIEAVQRANALTDIATARYQPSHLQWQKVKAGKKIDEFDLHVPRNIIYLVEFINRLFESETPMTMLEQAQPLLADFSGKKSLKTSAAAFDSLFDVAEVEASDELTQEEAEQAQDFLDNLND